MGNVPALRFSDFSGDWEQKKIGELCDFIVPGRNKPKVFKGGIPWITTPDLHRNYKVSVSRDGLYISQGEAKSIGSKVVPENSIIFSCVGELGTVSVSGCDVVINQQLHAFLPKDKILTDFLKNVLMTQGKYINKVATKTSVPYLNKDNCNSIPIFHPSLPEQQKIATFLSAVDKKLGHLRRKHALLENYKRGVMQKIFPSTSSGQARPEFRFKQDDGADFPDWEEKRLGDVITNIGGTALEKYVSADGTHKFISIGNYSTQGLYIDNGQRISPIEKASSKQLDKNNLVMVLNDKTATGDLIGSTILVEEDDAYIYNQRSERIICNDNFSPKFAWQLFNSRKFRKEIVSISQGGTQIYVNFPMVKKLRVNLPTPEEQQKIANFLSTLDKKLEAVQTQIDQTEIFKKGLLQKMFV